MMCCSSRSYLQRLSGLTFAVTASVGLWLVAPALGMAAEPDESEQSRPQSSSESQGRARSDEQLLKLLEEVELRSAWDWLESRRDDLSRNVTDAGRNLDDWLAGEFVGERENESYLRIRLNQRVGRHSTYHSTARISGRIDLPQASERWKLIFESESQQRRTLVQQRLDNFHPSSLTGGFRYELLDRGDWQFNHDIGLRARIPLDPFYRFRSRYGTELGENWGLGLDHRLYYYHQDGWAQDGRLYFSRELADTMIFRLSSEARYQHHLRQTEFAQIASIFQALGDLETMTYEVGVLGKNRPNTRINSYYAQILYRRAIYEDWLVMEVVPQLLTERAESWRPDPRVQFNIEVFFFDF